MAPKALPRCAENSFCPFSVRWLAGYTGSSLMASSSALSPNPGAFQVKKPTRKQGAIIALAASLAVPFEGLRQVAYYDPPGILTVCYGSTRSVQKGKVYSLQECHDRLDADMLEAAAAVDVRYPNAP